jgi:hypothetical protein
MNKTIKALLLISIQAAAQLNKQSSTGIAKTV